MAREAVGKTVEKIRETILRDGLIPQGACVLVGLSGGPDSVCLFHALATLRDALGFDLCAVHVNHGLRPEAETRGDAAYAEKLCARLGARFFLCERDVAALAGAWRAGEEEAGRRARYEAFFETAESLRREANIPKERIRVAVAHNRNDLAETVLMRVLRGTGLDGLAAMTTLRGSESGFAVIRPLLRVSRSETEAYCLKEALSPRRDSTNADTRYLRNRIRAELLPELAKTYNVNIVETLARLADNAAEDRDCLDALTRDLTAKHAARDADGRLRFPASVAADLHPALRRRLILRCLEMTGLTRDAESVHLRAALTLAARGRVGKTAEFPSGYRLLRDYDALVFYRADETPPPAPLAEREIPLSALFALASRGGGTLEIAYPEAGFFVAVSAFGRESDFRAAAPPVRFDLDRAAERTDRLTVRGRRPGDFMRPKGMRGHKKIQDLLTDAKIPRSERDGVVLALAGDEVFWLSRDRHSEIFAPTDATKTLFTLEYVPVT